MKEESEHGWKWSRGKVVSMELKNGERVESEHGWKWRRMSRGELVWIEQMKGKRAEQE